MMLLCYCSHVCAISRSWPTNLIFLPDFGPALIIQTSLLAAGLALALATVTWPDLMTLLFSLMLDLPWYKGFVQLSGLLLNLATHSSVYLGQGSYLTCNHCKHHFLYKAAFSYYSSEFLLLPFWLQGSWGHYWALKTLSSPTCNPLSDPTHEPGA